MFIRNKLVTNSSSTSFIFFGVYFDSASIKQIIDYLLLTHKDNTDEDELLYKWLNSMPEDIEVRVTISEDGQEGEVYIKDSFIYLEEYTVEDLPLDKIMKTKEKEDKWTNIILNFCNKYNITPLPSYSSSNSNSAPCWKVAIGVAE